MAQSQEQIPVWLDCDPGHDVRERESCWSNWVIINLAYHDNLHLLGISTVYGNAPLSKTTNNALSVLKAIGREDVFVHPGASKPFSRQVKHAPSVHGESGLDGTDLLPQPDRTALHHCNAVKDMRDALMYCPPDTAWLVVTGTLTNAALLFAVYPEVAQHIKGLSIMGGAVGADYTGVYMGPEYVSADGQTQARIGNMSPFAEFNIWCDPESARSIFTNETLKPKTTLITLDLTHQVCATIEARDMTLFSKIKQEPATRMRTMFYELLMFFASTYEKEFNLTEGPPLHDPIAVAVLLSELENGTLFDDFKKERWDVEVITEGEQVGRTKLHASSTGVFVPRKMNTTRFWDMIETCMSKADQATGFRT